MLVATPAAAEVLGASPNGFEIRESVQLVIPPDQAFDAFEQVGSWWNPAHTYSGKAANMRVALSLGACLCERFEDRRRDRAFARRLCRAEQARDPDRVARAAAVRGDVGRHGSDRRADRRRVARNDELSRGGFYKGGADKLAPLVDQVLADQMKRYRVYATARPRTR